MKCFPLKWPIRKNVFPICVIGTISCFVMSEPKETPVFPYLRLGNKGIEQGIDLDQ